MSVSITIDTSKSLAELTGIDWGVAPADAGTLVRERHEIRRTPIRDLPHAAIIRFLDMGSDADILVPVALERLRDDADAVGLLCAVLRAEHFGWRSQPELVAAVRDRIYHADNLLGQIEGDFDTLATRFDMWRFYAEFERGLSVV